MNMGKSLKCDFGVAMGICVCMGVPEFAHTGMRVCSRGAYDRVEVRDRPDKVTGAQSG
jgi:hypothetical protein